MGKREFVISNEKFKIGSSTNIKYKEVVFSYVFNGQLLRRFVFIKAKRNFPDSYYLDIAKKQIDEEKKNGTLVKYSKKYSRALKMTPKRKGITAAICTLLVAGVATGATFLALHFMNKGEVWAEITAKEANEIMNNLDESQGASYDDDNNLILDKKNPTLLNLIKEQGGQGRINFSLTNVATAKGPTNSLLSYNFNDCLYSFNCTDGIDGSYIAYRDDLDKGDTIYNYFFEPETETKEGDVPDYCMADSEITPPITLDEAQKRVEQDLYTVRKYLIHDFRGSFAAMIFGRGLGPLSTSSTFTKIIGSLADNINVFAAGGGEMYETIESAKYYSLDKTSIRFAGKATSAISSIPVSFDISGEMKHGICTQYAVNVSSTDEQKVISYKYSNSFEEVKVPDMSNWPTHGPLH